MNESELEAVIRGRLALDSQAFELTVVQQPEYARALGKPEKIRGAKWPLDPPPVIEFAVHDNDIHRSYLHSPFWFCTAEIESTSHQTGSSKNTNLLSGSLVSSLHKVKLSDNKEHGYFIFGDLNVKTAGTYCLKFTLFEMRQSPEGRYAAKLNQTLSQQFQIYSPKAHVPARESTQLSKMLCEAGVKLRIRKEPSNRKRQCPDWSAQPSGPFWGTPMLPPPNSSLPNTFQYLPFSVGLDVTSRLSLGNSDLGIRDYMNKEVASNSQHVPNSYMHKNVASNSQSLSDSYMNKEVASNSQNTSMHKGPSSDPIVSTGYQYSSLAAEHDITARLNPSNSELGHREYMNKEVASNSQHVPNSYMHKRQHTDPISWANSMEMTVPPLLQTHLMYENNYAPNNVREYQDYGWWKAANGVL